MSKKIFIFALDGTPYTLLKKMIANGTMENFASLAKQGSFLPIQSVIPPVSSTAWASFMTGKKPQDHGILSFTERNAETMEWYTPNANHLKTKTVFQELSDSGKRVFVMNVPVTFPPKKINGISICGFLGNDISTGTYPIEVGHFLKQKNYRIDADVEIAKSDLKAFVTDLNNVLDKRIEIMEHYFAQEQWDFFMMHIMETDRLHHFTWEFMENGIPAIVNLYNSFYGKLDKLIGDIAKRLNDDYILMLLSDHGFTTLKKEVYLNTFLWQNNLLHFSKPFPDSLKDIHPNSKAYALYPGRIFINLKGREKNGSINSGLEYDQLRNLLKGMLLNIVAPDSNEKVIQSVLWGEDIYGPKSGNFSERSVASREYADIICLANEGYDLKGQLWSKEMFKKTVYNGMHTIDNAFFLVKGDQLAENEISIMDLKQKIMDYMGIVTP